jgi:hypothetical protein
MKEFLSGLNRKFKLGISNQYKDELILNYSIGESLSDMKEKSKQRADSDKGIEVEKENKSENSASIEADRIAAESKESEDKVVQEKSPSTGVEKLPRLDSAVRDFTVQNIAKELVADVEKSDRKEVQPIANEKALEIEQGNYIE